MEVPDGRRQVSPCPAVADGAVYVGAGDGRLYALDIRRGQEKWKSETAAGVGEGSCPAVSGEVVYFGCDDGNLYAVDAQSGQTNWTFFAGFCTWGSGVWSSPSISGRAAYVGGHDSLYALDLATGEKLWRFKTDRPIISSPAVSDGVVYFTSTGGTLYAVK